MEIDTNQVFNSFENQPLKDNNDKILTLRDVIISSLIGVYPDEQSLSGEDKFERGELASKIYNNNNIINLKAEEIVLIKKLIAKMYGTFIVWSTYKILDK